MKKQLLKKLSLCIMFLMAMTMFGQQSWTFDSGAQNWTESFGSGSNATVGWDSDGGNGALKIIRLTNNANAGVNTAGGLNVDADANKWIRLKIKNLTKGVDVRIGATGGDTTNGNKAFSTAVVQESDYAILYLDMTGESYWNGILTNFWIAIRKNVGTDSDAVYLDSVEIISSVPADEFSEFIKNPNFEDTSGIVHMTGNQSEVTRELTAAMAQTGDQSLKLTHIIEPTKNNFIFSNFEKDYTSAPIPANSQLTVKLWVRSTRSLSSTVIVRLKINNTSGTTETITDRQDTSGTPNTWEELTFTLSNNVIANDITFWLAVEWLSGNPEGDNPVNGDIFYFDNMYATIGGVLSNNKNTLEGVSIYPNPASNFIKVKTQRGGDVKLYSILGRLVKSKDDISNDYEMNISDLKSGMYLLKVTSEHKSLTQKIIIQ